MKNLSAFLFLFFLLLSAVCAQDTVRLTACTRYWKNQQPINGTEIFVDAGDIEYKTVPGPGKHCAKMVVPVVGLPSNTLILAYAEKPLPNEPEDQAINGVTVGDLMHTTCHYLGLGPFTNVMQVVAADVNNGGSITTFDIVEAEKIVLGTYIEWPSNVVWRFPSLIFDPTMPFGPPIYGGYSLTEFKAFHNDTLFVLGTKTGDVDGDANSTGTYIQPPGITDTLTLNIPNVPIPANTSIEVPLSIQAPSVGGFQVEFHLAPGVSIVDLSSIGPSMHKAYSILNDNICRVVAFRQNGLPITNNALYLKVTSAQTANLQDVLSVSKGLPFLGFTGCGQTSGAYQMALRFDNILATPNPSATALRAAPAAPNPFTDKALMKIELPEALPVLLEVFDLGGRLLWSQEQVLGSGAQQLEIPAEALPSGGMGLYRIRAGSGVATGKVFRQ